MTTTRKSILVVQSREILCLGLQSYLQICGLRPTFCEWASSITAARRLTKEKPPDVLIIDPFMEQQNGMLLIQELHARQTAPLIIAYASRFRLEEIESLFKIGVAAIVSHDTDDKSLLKVLLDTIGGARRVVATNLESSFDKLNAVWRVSPALVDKLSKQQREVFRMLGEAEPVKEIARKLKISPRSIETYEARLKDVLHLPNNAALRRVAILHHAWEEASSGFVAQANNLR